MKRKRSSVLDGPQMGYGSVEQSRRGGVSLSTVILAIVCVVLAVLLILSIAGRQQSSGGGGSSTTPSPTAGIDTPPAGAGDAVAAFAGAWSLPPAQRDDALASVSLTEGTDTVTEANAVSLAKTQPNGAAAYTRVSDQALYATQPMADGSTLQLHLVFDQAAIYGWLVSSVQLVR